MSAVLGIDPGTRKCGYAVVGGAGGPALVLGIAGLAELGGVASEVALRFGVGAIALGRGTHAAQVRALLAPLALEVALVDEKDTTYLARARYFADHPPRGWRRWIPLGMLLPPRPIDDYAALIIAERYLATQAFPSPR